MESANKLVVEARLQGSGMRWARQNVPPLLALRGVVCSGQWERAWPTIWQELHRQEAERRRQRRARRRVAKEQAETERERAAGILAALPPTPPRSPTIVDGHPTAEHPWHQPYDPVRSEMARARAGAKS